jgi:STE24 endopeptidase
MSWFEPVALTCGLFILARGGARLWLERLNRRSVLLHAAAVPDAFKGLVDEPTYAKSVQYALANGRLRQVEAAWDCVVLLGILGSGVLPWAFNRVAQAWGEPAWAMAGFLFAAGVALSLPSLPLEWYDQFRLEERFGFNTTTPKLWWMDRLKGLLLGLALGFPLLWLVLKLVQWTGHLWWLWAWAALLAFQLIIAVLAPVLILPLFNKFTPLPDGGLRNRLLRLADRTGFRAHGIQVMDGSKRSRHSNAFFTGFGRWRKIVLFDTLVQQLAEPELEAVLAHEIGHFKKRHIPKMLALSALGSLAGFLVLDFLLLHPWFLRAFGFAPGSLAPALLLFALLAGVVTFWTSPVVHWWSRRHEYQADAFAVDVMREPDSLIGALRKLNEKNLSNLTPHPLYSGFYYSHPTLLEREHALRQPG